MKLQTLSSSPQNDQSLFTEKIRALKDQLEKTAPIEVAVDLVPTADPFKSIFPIKEYVVESIQQSMEKNDYDLNEPIIIGVFIDFQAVVDGHTRLEAAKRAGLKKVWVVYRKFISIEAAIDYAIHRQRDRRNLTDAEILGYIEQIDFIKTKGRGKTSKESGRSAEITAKKLGVSATQVKKVRAVKNSQDPELINEVKSGKLSINKAYQKTKDKKQAKQPEPDLTEWRGQELYLLDPEIKLIEMGTLETVFPNSTELMSQIKNLIEKTMRRLI